MDAVIMCGDWDPDPPVKLFRLNYIIIHNHISKQDAVWLCHSRGRRLFSGGKFPEVSVQRADGRSDLFSSQTLSELKLFAGDFFEQKYEEESGVQAENG